MSAIARTRGEAWPGYANMPASQGDQFPQNERLRWLHGVPCQ